MSCLIVNETKGVPESSTVESAIASIALGTCTVQDFVKINVLNKLIGLEQNSGIKNVSLFLTLIMVCPP